MTEKLIKAKWPDKCYHTGLGTPHIPHKSIDKCPKCDLWVWYYNMHWDGIPLQFWKRVKWWHFKMKRKIKRANR